MLMHSSYGAYSQWKSWSYDQFGLFGNDDAVYFKRELEHAGVYKVQGLRILEIGFGNGQFASWAHENGAHWTGTEAQSLQVEAARARGWSAFSADADLAQLAERRAFDLVVAFDQ